MKSISKILLITGMLIVSHGAMADTSSDRLDHKLYKHKSRIVDGVDSGELTRWERRSLRQELREIREQKNEFAKDGHLSWKERRSLKRQLKRAKKQLYRFKNNKYSANHQDSDDCKHRGKHNRSYNHGHRISSYNRSRHHGKNGVLLSSWEDDSFIRFTW